MTKIEIYLHYKTILEAEAHILTGSYVLKLQGLIKKEPQDLDIILVNPTETAINTLKKLQEETNAGFRKNYQDSKMYQIKHHGTRVDFFIETKKESDTLKLENGVQVASVINIINAKKRQARDKDILDLMSISKLILSSNEISSHLDNRR